MAQFLNTTATSYFLEDMIKNARERLILISPFLRLNDRIKELLEDKNRLKIDVRIVYGKNELQPSEIKWLQGLDYVRTSFCENLHAKCYLNEEICIITSLNLYEFSQVNNNEMGVLVDRVKDAQLYSDTYEEAQRIIRISDEVRLSVETLGAPRKEQKTLQAQKVQKIAIQHNDHADTAELLTTAKLAKQLHISTADLIDALLACGYLALCEEKIALTDKGRQAGGVARKSKFGADDYFQWPANMDIPGVA